MITKAAKVCLEAHNSIGQVRKYTNEPYWTHPYIVAGILISRAKGEPSICAAYLHDVLEDVALENPDYNEENLRQMFGSEIVDLVIQVTEVSRSEDGNRAIRKQMDLEHYSKGCREAQTIKVADMIHNTMSIVEFDRDFARVYLKEKQALLDVLKRADPALLSFARRQIEESKLFLKGDVYGT